MNKLEVVLMTLALAACSGNGHGDTGDANPDAGNSDSGGSGGGGGGRAHGSGGRTGTGGGGSGGLGAGGTGHSGAGGGGGAGSGGAPGDDAGTTMTMKTQCSAPVVAKNPGNSCPSGDPVTLKATLVKDGFDTPIFVTYVPGESDHLLVVERGGMVKRLDLGSGDVSMFLDVSDRSLPASGNDEFGLLGLAVHPDFPDDPRIFLNYVTDPNMDDTSMNYYGHTNVSSFEAKVDGSSADPKSEMVLVNFGQPESNHNGGMLAFGPDGCLFIGAGDGGNSNDTGTGHEPGGNGQALDTPLAKILRIDVDDPSSSAPGNLKATYKHIWDYGIRNPWRFSFDRDTGDLYIGDVGQGAVEEVDVEPKGAGHKNYGWPIGEGTKCLGGGMSCDLTGLISRSRTTRTFKISSTAWSAATSTAAARSSRCRAGTCTETTDRPARSPRSCGTARSAARTRSS